MAVNVIYFNETVWEAGLNRMRWLFDEFDNIMVNSSGGKDSAVVLGLALMVAEEKGRLPLDVMFVDQEGEWQATIDYMRIVRDDPRVRLHWLQIPIRLFNSASTTEPWLYCWEEGKTWLREKELDSIHENTLGTMTFGDVFNKYTDQYFKGQKYVALIGMRTEESPGRRNALTVYGTYKGETWGGVESKTKQQFYMCPIYDWSYVDVWKAIHDNGWHYNKLYDYQYQYGVPIREMRVSNVHHETALKSLYYMQEIDKETWGRLVERLSGINTVGILNEHFMAPKVLPFMFSSWKEYRDFLLERLVLSEPREILRRQFAAHDGRYIPEVQEQLNKAEISMILVNDFHGTKYHTFHAAHGMDSIKYRGDRDLPLHGAVPKDHVHTSTIY